MSECRLLTPLHRDGTSRRQRAPRALDPGTAPIDQRSTADRLLYAADLARLLRYYTEQNEPSGDWAPFLEHDISTLVARVGAYDGSALQADFDRRRTAAMTAADAGTFGPAFVELVRPLIELASVFESWRHASIAGLQLRQRIDRLITGVLADALREGIAAVKRAHALGAPAPPAAAGFSSIWGDLDPPANGALFASGGFDNADERRIALLAVAQAFERLHEGTKRLKDRAPRFLAETLARYPQHQPHVALFLAFLRLLNHAGRAMNGLTAAHLDFYYRDVLRLVPRGPVADRVHVILELAKNLPPSPVPAGTALNAGKDARGVRRIYRTDRELLVNRAALHPEQGLKRVFVDLGPGDVVRNIHADTLPPPAGADQRWRPFGSVSLPFARVGFAIASPMLWLAEGTRVVKLRWVVAAASDILRNTASALLVQRELTHNVVVDVTGPKGWIPATVLANVGTGAEKFIELTITIPPTAPAVVGLDPKVHGETFETTLPVLRVLMKNDGLPGGDLPDRGPTPVVIDYSEEAPGYAPNELVRFEGRVYKAGAEVNAPGLRPGPASPLWTAIPYVNPYKYFERVRVRRLALSVDVTGMRGVVLENDFGALNPAKPFLPFGPMPRAGASLLIGSWEIFQKRVSAIDVAITWAGLPGNLATHYDRYRIAGARIVADNAYFTADLQLLREGAWVTKSAAGGAALFQPAAGAPDTRRTIPVSFTPGELPRDPSLPPFQRFDRSLARGFLRLALRKSFLHEMFPVVLAQFAAESTTAPTPPAAPNPPYTPSISELTIGYQAAEVVEYDQWARSDVESRVERLYHVGPFGHQEFAPVAPAAAVPGVEPAGAPVPAFTASGDDPATAPAEGTLYLGLANLTPPQNLSLLFQLAEGSEDPGLPPPDVQWSYLTSAGWKDFARAEVTLDTTSELIGSGLVQFAVPAPVTDRATILPADLCWLRATVRRGTGAVPNAVAVLTQAVAASFRDEGNDPHHLEVPLPAGTIGKLVERLAPIKSVSQPFSSFGGRPAEQDDAFRVRVAERLRHKRRAVTIFDYERLVLERFPEVYKVRCLSHTNAESELAPGAVRVVVVPNLRNRNAVDPLRPRLSLSKLEAIRRDLVSMATDFADIQVVNPDYEEVRVRFNVRFRPGFDRGHYTGQLEQDIIRFLSPWLHDDGVDLAFGGRVHRSALLNFIDEREYVDFVTGFEMDHIVPGAGAAGSETRTNVEEAEPTRSSAVIVPAATHVVGDDIVSCSDEAGSEPVPATPTAPFVPAGPRYLGNVRTRELHDLWSLTRYCQIDEIAIDRKYPFRRIEDAQALGYDFCAYCFEGRSRR